MARKRSIIERMKNNPRDNWQISDVQKVCEQEGIGCRSPKRGDHYSVFSNCLDEIVTVPAHRPIKAVYIKKFVRLVELHRAGNDNG